MRAIDTKKKHEPIEKIVCKTPQDWKDIEFNAPNPKGSTTPLFQVTQEEEEEDPTIQRSRCVQQLKLIQLLCPKYMDHQTTES